MYVPLTQRGIFTLDNDCREEKNTNTVKNNYCSNNAYFG